MRVSSLQDVCRANLCTGCGICEAISGPDKVRMAIDHEGFYRPQILQSDPEAWEIIRQVCPGILLRQDKNQPAAHLERLWGVVEAVHAGYSTDKVTRWRASSGGALSAILIYLLETGKVDYVIHVGASKNDPFLTSVRKSFTPEQVLENAGSRYAPTAPLVGLRDLLENHRDRIAFVGKPCDIAALRAYGKLNRQVGSLIPVLVSFFCAGVPSLLATYELVDTLGVDRNKVRQFQYRGFGWPGRATAVDESGQEFSMSYEDSWGRILATRLQFRCKICPDGIGEAADIVCGDAWHIQDGHPSFDERPGQSLVLARTATGSQLLEAAQSAGYLEAIGFALEELQIIQPYQKNRRQAIASRLFAMWLAGKPIPRYEGFYLFRNAWDAGLPAFLRQFGGMFRRLMLERT